MEARHFFLVQARVALCVLVCAVTSPALAASGAAAAVKAPPLAGKPAASAPAAAGQADSLRVTPRFKAGDVLHLRIVKGGRVERDGVLLSRQAQGGDVVVRVLAADAQGARLDCVYGAQALLDGTDPALRADPLLKVMLASREGVRVRIAAGPRFANPHVENADELLAGFRATLDKAVATMPPEVGPAVQRMLEQMMGNKQVFAAKISEDLFVYLSMLGVDVPLQGALVGAGETPSMLGGAPVRTWSSLRVERYDRAANVAQLRYVQTSNPQDAQAAASALADSIRREAVAQYEALPPAQRAPDQPPPAGESDSDAAAAKPDYRSDDSVLFDVDLASGWPTRVARERVVQAGDRKMIETLLIEQMPP